MVQDAVHLPDNPEALRRVVHVLHPREQPVEFRIGIVRGIFSALGHLSLVTVEQEKEVFRIRVVSIPAEVVKLDVALADLVLEAVEIRRADHELDIELRKLPGQPVEP